MRELPAMPATIAFLEETLIFGGAERIQQSLIKHLDRERFRPIVCCLRDIGPIGREIQADGVPVYHNLAKAKLDPLAPFRLAAIFRKERVRVVHSINYLTRALVYGRIACWLAGVPAVVVAVHSTGYMGKTSFRRWGTRLLSPFVAKYIALADAHREFFSRETYGGKDKIAVIRTGIDVSRFEPSAWPDDARALIGLPSGAKVVGIIAALRKEKRHDIFLKAARIILDNLPDAYFLVVGDGPERETTERHAVELGIADKVKFTGRMDTPALAMKALDVQVLCSDDVVETSPVALLEASAMRVPIVSTRVGSIHEQVIDGETGILVPSGDADALAAAILRLLKDPETARRMGEAGRRLIVERFSVERMTRDYEQLFLSALGQKEG